MEKTNANKTATFLWFLRSFFPFQLLIAHLKHNLLALFYWLLLFLIITDQFGSAFGVPLLFYSPEYLGHVSPLSFGILGFAIGGFNMGFNTYSYMKLAPSYQFLAMTVNPFLKFCANNFIIPLVFTVTYLIQVILFQIDQEFASAFELLAYVVTYLIGFGLFHLLSAMYFFPMNRRGRKSIIDLNEEKESKVNKIASTVIPTKNKWNNLKSKETERVYLYLGKRLKIYSSRSNKHYKQDLLTRIYERNKINATIFETITLLTFILLGLFRDLPFFEFPAAVSITLLLTIVLMLFSAMLSWLHRWTYPVLILLLVAMDVFSVKTPFFRYTNYLYGLDYSKTHKVDYTLENIEAVCNGDFNQQKTKTEIIKMLDKWRLKTKKDKPKLILINVSGGGSRSALWVLNCMQNLDKELNHQFFKHTQMITGASGGLVGAAYYRQIDLLRQQKKLDNPFDPVYRDRISADLLNRLSFAASTNDLFFRYQKVNVNGKIYTKDRGLAFEDQLNENTRHMMDVPLKYYEPFEKNADIPLMIFTPTIVNDGRRMLISSQRLTFLTDGIEGPSRFTKSYENIDYQSFFEKQQPGDVKFTSVMRASATFPFVMPMVTLPSSPEIQLMDAGIRDNYGGKITMEYLDELSSWIEQNTSGVIILQIRDTKKVLDNESYQQISFMDKFSLPFGNMYKNFPRTQDFDQEELMKIGTQQFDFPVDLISFNLRENSKDRISLSWHLTKQEKLKIASAFKSKRNTHSLELLKKLLN